MPLGRLIARARLRSRKFDPENSPFSLEELVCQPCFHGVKLHLLVVATGPRALSWAPALIVRLSKNPYIETRAIVDDVVPRLIQTTRVIPNLELYTTNPLSRTLTDVSELLYWADLLVCVPLALDDILKMETGEPETLVQRVLRHWDEERAILIYPGIDEASCPDPWTLPQLEDLPKGVDCMRFMEPITLHCEPPAGTKDRLSWKGFDQLVSIIEHQAGMLQVGCDSEVTADSMPLIAGHVKVRTKLPPEVWTLIMTYTGDWELSTAIGVYSTLPMPPLWTLNPKNPLDPVKVYEHELEWTVLTKDSVTVCQKLSEAPSNFRMLPVLVIKLLVKFKLVDVLTWLANKRPDLFSVLDDDTLPTLASAIYPRTEVLEFWRQNRGWACFYTSDAMDIASANGHVQILDWWWKYSGLPMLYTSEVWDEASSHGHIHLLNWWRIAAISLDATKELRTHSPILRAAKHGQVGAVRWWLSSGLPVRFRSIPGGPAPSGTSRSWKLCGS